MPASENLLLATCILYRFQSLHGISDVNIGEPTF